MFFPTWGCTHLSSAGVTPTQRPLGAADNPTKAAGERTDRRRHQRDSERQEGRVPGHIPCLCCSAELERLQVELSQHPSQT